MFKRKISELESIIDTYQDMLFQFAYYRIGSFEIAQDIVQELFIKLFQEQSKLNKISNIKGYLLKSISNRCIDYHRQKRWDIIPIEGAHKEASDESQQHYYNDFITIEQILSSIPYEQAKAAIEQIVKANYFSVTAKMRTKPNENFSHIDPSLEFININFTKLCNAPYQWHIEKENGRRATFNGDSVFLWSCNSPLGFKGGRDYQFGVLEEFSTMLEPRELLNYELQQLSSENSSFTIKTINNQTTLTIESSAIGNFANDYMLNSTISESQNRRIYKFDRETEELKSFIVTIFIEGEEIIVLESCNIQYNDTFVAGNITTIPNIEWREIELPKGDKTLTNMSALQAVTKILNSLEVENFELIESAFHYYDSNFIKDKFMGLKVIEIGKPFK